jgi:hypothetical protein
MCLGEQFGAHEPPGLRPRPASMPRDDPATQDEPHRPERMKPQEHPAPHAVSPKRMMGLEPTTFCMASEPGPLPLVAVSRDSGVKQADSCTDQWLKGRRRLPGLNAAAVRRREEIASSEGSGLAFSCRSSSTYAAVLCGRQSTQETAMALRAGFAAASLLGVVTTAGTTLWLAAVLTLVALAGGLAATETLPRLGRGDRS